MALWGDAGPVPRWSFPVESAIGSKHDIVCDIISYDSASGYGLVSLYPCRTKARIMSGFPEISPDVISFAVIGAEYVDGIGMPGFRINDPSLVFSHPRIEMGDLHSVIELCCGIGVGTYGLEAAGYRIAVANDCNESMLQGYASLHPEVPLVLGSFSEPQVLRQIHSHHPRSALLVSGFSCQPFSEGVVRRDLMMRGRTRSIVLLRLHSFCGVP